MPQLGESIVEATVARWLVKPGSTVERGQPIAEVETDKATNEIPAPAAGVIGEILVPEGQTVKVGTEILRYTEGAAAAPTAAAAPDLALASSIKILLRPSASEVPAGTITRSIQAAPSAVPLVDP